MSDNEIAENVKALYNIDRKLKPLQKAQADLKKWFKERAGVIPKSESKTFAGADGVVVVVRSAFKRAIDKIALIAEIGQSVYDSFYREQEQIEVTVRKESAAKPSKAKASPKKRTKAS